LANSGTVWLILQLVGGQPTHTAYVTAGDCEMARCRAVYGEACVAGRAPQNAVKIADVEARCEVNIKHPRIQDDGIDWPLPVTMQKASYEIAKPPVAKPAAKPPVRKVVAKKPVRKAPAKAPAKKR
jgi:hypothetical protein